MELSCRIIKEKFKVQHFIPDKKSLITNDGYDVLEKEDATRFYKGKNFGHVLEHLRSGGEYYLEEWSVLTRPALTHYAPSFFCYLLETLDSDEPDEEFIFFLLGELYQLIYMHKGSPFNTQQTEIMNELVNLCVKQSKNLNKFEYYSEDIKFNADEYFIELKKYTA